VSFASDLYGSDELVLTDGWVYEIATEIDKWVDYNFPNRTIEQQGLGLGEEAGECLRAILKRVQQIRGTHEEWTTELKRELGDVMIKVFTICSDEGFDVHDVLVDRWKDISTRDLVTNPKAHGIEGS
jgi:NTP pyrophosphatase (non-canonical NTP hydrolase)